MKTNNSNPPCEDVLNAFSMEAIHNRSTLERYLTEYPQFATEISDLWREFSREVEKPRRLSDNEKSEVQEAWRIYSTSTSEATATLLTSLSVPKQRELSSRLEVPRQIIAAFRERKVIVSSIPRTFLNRLAEGLNASVEQVIAALSLPQVSALRSNKSDEKPISSEPTTFEKLLIEAQVSEAKRAELLAN